MSGWDSSPSTTPRPVKFTGGTHWDSDEEQDNVEPDLVPPPTDQNTATQTTNEQDNIESDPVPPTTPIPNDQLLHTNDPATLDEDLYGASPQPNNPEVKPEAIDSDASTATETTNDAFQEPPDYTSPFLPKAINQLSSASTSYATPRKRDNRSSLTSE